ncbi:helix-turn-helix domain-containing protein [Microbacterium hatanonis]|uniref:helix-turn-helix domain-containing protein n=1 Tax=Microbacterium hatanonis TaxID=404366 RepID=UPI00164F80C1|nr:helix-turn-helix transcriptional regulator [Microbacterium hatanonis]
MAQHPFGELLRRRRHYADLTLEHLAELAGVSTRTVSDIERGVSVGPQRRTVIALANALELADHDRAEFLGAARLGRLRTATNVSLSSIQPFRLPDFTGREAEMTALVSLLSSRTGEAASSVLVTGMAGVGKTTVALEAVHRATAGTSDVLFVNLHSPDTLPLFPLQVLQSLLRQKGPQEEHATMEGAFAAWRRVSAIEPLAVVLDNVTDEDQVRPVLATARPVVVALTSRRSLGGLEGCQRVVLATLPRADSIAFLARIIPEGQRARGDLAELAELCSDLPLALRIAGNRISSRPTWTVEDFVQRLRAHSSRLRHLVAGDLRVGSTFALSYEALSPRSRQVFRSLPLIVGSSFRADMVASIHGYDVETTDGILGELADLALLEPLSGDRYRMHDLLRIFAEERLGVSETPQEIEPGRARLRSWTLEKAREMALVDEEMDAAHEPGDVTLPSAREWLTTEADSWLDALRVAAATPTDSLDLVLGTAEALVQFAERWLSFPHWRTVARIAVTAAEQFGDEARLAKQLQMLSALELGLLDANPDIALEIARRARETAERAGAGDAATWALISIAWSETHRGESDAALRAARHALEEALEGGLVEPQVQSRYWIAIGLLDDDPEGALHQAAEMRTTIDDHESDLSLRQWSTLNNLSTAISAKVLIRLGRYSEAVEVANRMMDDAPFFPHEPDFLARAYRHRGFAHLGLGERENARSDLRRALDLVQEHERPDWWAAEIQDALDSLDRP